MSDLAEDYRLSTDEQKLDILRIIYNDPKSTAEERAFCAEEGQKIYNRMRGRDTNPCIMNIIKGAAS